MPAALQVIRFSERFPVIATVELAAVVVTAWWWWGGDIGMLTVDYRVWQGQVWRLLTSALPHVNIYHLVFNLYWLVVFGRQVEQTFGSRITALWLGIFAVGSAAAEYALAQGGVGLSGVGYGLFAFLWVLSKRDARFADSVNAQTAQLFVLWFFLCIGLTYADTWQLANVAHAAGAVLGALAGLVMAPPLGYRRQLAAGILVCTLVAALVAGGWARRFINFTDAVGPELAYRGYEALQRNDNRAAIAALEAAVRQPAAEAGWWHNLGIAYQRESRDRDAEQAYRRAMELDPTDSDARAFVEWFESRGAE